MYGHCAQCQPGAAQCPGQFPFLSLHEGDGFLLSGAQGELDPSSLDAYRRGYLSQCGKVETKRCLPMTVLIGILPRFPILVAPGHPPLQLLAGPCLTLPAELPRMEKRHLLANEGECLGGGEWRSCVAAAGCRPIRGIGRWMPGC